MPHITKSIEMNIPADQLWNEAAHKFEHAGVWASTIDASKPNSTAPAPAEASIGGRVCATPGFGEVKETFLSFDETNRTFSYQAEASGLPGFVKGIVNTWKVEPTGPKSARLTMNVDMAVAGVGKLMGPMMSLQLGRALDTSLKDFKHYLETGTISPAKEKANAKLAKNGGTAQRPAAA